MGTHEDILKNRRLVTVGIVLSYAAAIALTIIRIVNTDFVTIGEILGSLALGAALAAPATLALLSLDRRPTLLPAAATGAVVTSVIATVVLPVGLIVGFIWYRAWSERPVRASASSRHAAARVGLGFMLLVSMLTLFVHMDPVCVQRLTDGTERSVDAASRGFATGWSFTSGGNTFASSSSGTDVASEDCTSDTVVLGEAFASLAFTAMVLEAGRRWPKGVAKPTPEGARVGAG